MRNIFHIIISDYKRLTSSVVAIVVLLGLCIVPCLYAWFNIFSNWAPYESEATGRIRVAVANDDKGDVMMGLSVNVGEKITEALEANHDIGWVFTEDPYEHLSDGSLFADPIYFVHQGQVQFIGILILFATALLQLFDECLDLLQIEDNPPPISIAFQGQFVNNLSVILLFVFLEGIYIFAVFLGSSLFFFSSQFVLLLLLLFYRIYLRNHLIGSVIFILFDINGN